MKPLLTGPWKSSSNGMVVLHYKYSGIQTKLNFQFHHEYETSIAQSHNLPQKNPFQFVASFYLDVDRFKSTGLIFFWDIGCSDRIMSCKFDTSIKQATKYFEI